MANTNTKNSFYCKGLVTSKHSSNQPKDVIFFIFYFFFFGKASLKDITALNPRDAMGNQPLTIYINFWYKEVFKKKHCENCKTLPFEHRIGCQCVKWFLLNYVTITTVTITKVTITTVTITTVTITTVPNVTKFQSQDFSHKTSVTKFQSQNSSHKILVTKWWSTNIGQLILVTKF